jgi:DNA-binding PadR family transcriptional regulator
MLLSALSHGEELYGYEMTKMIQQGSNKAISLREGYLYTFLYSLEDAGYIKSTKRQVSKRMVRTYYSITDAGHAKFKELLTEYEVYTNTINQLIYHSAELIKHDDTEEA